MTKKQQVCGRKAVEYPKISSRVINWFNIENKINFNPSSEERLFGILSDLHEKVLVRKFNYTMLFMRYYIYANKLHNKPILLQDFVGKMIIKYRIEKL